MLALEDWYAALDEIFRWELGTGRNPDWDWNECYESALTPEEAFEDWFRHYTGKD